MRFVFTEDQRLFQSTVRDYLTKQCPPDEVRALWSDPVGRSQPRWSGLAEMGVIGLLVPAGFGGLGMDEVDLVLLLEETGRAAMPEAVVETAAVATRLLSEAASPELQQRWLSAIAAGEAVVSVGLESVGPYVTDAHVADLLLLERQGQLHAVERGDFAVVAAAVGRRGPAHLPRRVDPVAGDPLERDGRPDRRRLRSGGPRHRRPTRRHRRPHDRDDRGVRPPARAVRQAHRIVSGRQAPAGQCPAQGRLRPPGRLPGRLVGRPRRRRPGPATSRWPKPSRPTPSTSRLGCRCRSTGPSATRGSTTCTCG